MRVVSISVAAAAAVAFVAEVKAQSSTATTVASPASSSSSSSSMAAVASSSVASSVASSSSSITASSSSSSSDSSTTSTSSTSNSTFTATASCAFTLPVADATATWPPGLAVQSSVPYVMTVVDLDDVGLPEMDYNLSFESDSLKEALCSRQMSYCATAGCAVSGAKVKDNFCNPTTLGSACTCTEGASNLAQYQWPVSSADCSNRAVNCLTQCYLSTDTDFAACSTACRTIIRASCGTPGQVSANYAVTKSKDTPSYAVQQGANSSSSTSAAFPRVLVTRGNTVLAAGTSLVVALLLVLA